MLNGKLGKVCFCMFQEMRAMYWMVTTHQLSGPPVLKRVQRRTKRTTLMNRQQRRARNGRVQPSPWSPSPETKSIIICLTTRRNHVSMCEKCLKIIDEGCTIQTYWRKSQTNWFVAWLTRFSSLDQLIKKLNQYLFWKEKIKLAFGCLTLTFYVFEFWQC